MFLLAVMLIVALVPTANFDWVFFDDFEDDDIAVKPSDYVACLFTGVSDLDPNSYYYMVMSIMVISTSFLTRVINLYPNLSEWSKQLKGHLSQRTLHNLRSLHDRSSNALNNTDTRVERHHKAFASLFRSLIYQPVCVLFLVFRATLDIYTSLLWEVGFIISL